MPYLYQTYRSYLKKRFGAPVLKIPVSGGFSCPNRDGTKSTEGCSFCDNRSFSPVALDTSSAVSQLKRAIERSSPRYRFFLPYLQPFTNTYGTVKQLQSMYEPLVTIPGVIGLAVGTRPDCLPDDVCDYLADLNTRTYLSVEVGLQSASDATLARSNRGHTVSDFETAVKKLAQRNIETVAHVMIGLAGDDTKAALNTARKVASLPVHGIKIHQLMIIAGTQCEKLYNAGALAVLGLEEYTELVSGFISLLRPDQYIHRIMADSKPQHGLIAPLWSAAKMKALEAIHKYMEEHRMAQGKNYSSSASVSF